jgi:hypothetical protein
VSTVAGGDVILAADNNNLENRLAAVEGRLTVTTATSAASATSSTTELAVDQVTKTLVSGKVYRVRWVLAWSGTVGTDVFFVLLRSGSGTGGTQLTFRSVLISSLFGATLETFFTAGSSGSQTFTGTVRRSSGTGTMTCSGSATQPRHLTVELMS